MNYKIQKNYYFLLKPNDEYFKEYEDTEIFNSLEGFDRKIIKIT
jgi:hypothetical protein